MSRGLGLRQRQYVVALAALGARWLTQREVLGAVMGWRQSGPLWTHEHGDERTARKRIQSLVRRGILEKDYVRPPGWRRWRPMYRLLWIPAGLPSLPAAASAADGLRDVDEPRDEHLEEGRSR